MSTTDHPMPGMRVSRRADDECASYDGPSCAHEASVARARASYTDRPEPRDDEAPLLRLARYPTTSLDSGSAASGLRSRIRWDK